MPFETVVSRWTARHVIWAGMAALVLALVGASSAAATVSSRAAVLAEGVGMGASPSAQVRTLQRALERHGFDVGSSGVDGRFGPLTAAAMRRLQARVGLAADGVVGPRTRRALARLAGGSPRRGRRAVGRALRSRVGVRALQRTLRRHGFAIGPRGVDGRFGPRTLVAVRRLQARYGLVADGVIGPQTRRVLIRLERARGAQSARVSRTGALPSPAVASTTRSTGATTAAPVSAASIGSASGAEVSPPGVGPSPLLLLMGLLLVAGLGLWLALT